MKTIQKATITQNTTVLLRADFNVPIKNNKIVDTYRIDTTIKTINHIIKKGGILTIVSHLGDDGTQSLLPVYLYLKKKYNLDISFFQGPLNKTTVNIIKKERTTQIVLVENLRMNTGEKKNTPLFAQLLASLGDIYINDAFSVSHRSHASVVGVPHYIPSYAGFQLQSEVEKLSKVFTPKHPFLFILGGNKFSTKIELLKKFEKKADAVFLGGALMNDMLLSVGFPVGVSLVEGNKKNTEMLQKLYVNKKCITPQDVIVERAQKSLNVDINEVLPKDSIYDIGKETTKELLEKVHIAKTVLWNGPLGKYDGGYDKASKTLLKALSASKKQVIIGGGDTVALVHKMKLQETFTHVSTGGGATLDFLAQGTLPGILALK